MVLRKTEKAHVDLEAECSLANRTLHEAETSSSSLSSQLKVKQEELRGTIVTTVISDGSNVLLADLRQAWRRN